MSLSLASIMSQIYNSLHVNLVHMHDARFPGTMFYHFKISDCRFFLLLGRDSK